MINKKGNVWFAKCNDGTYDIVVFSKDGRKNGNYNYDNLALIKEDYKDYELINLGRKYK